MTRISRILLIAMIAVAANVWMTFAVAQKPYQPERDATPTGTWFERCFTQD